MGDRRNAVPLSRAKAPRVPADGIIGRLTYIPAQGDEGIGQIRRNRAKDETPRFKQITPFSQWCAPTRTPTSQPSDMRPSQVARSQKYWLLEHFPEASVGNEDVESLLLQEIATAQTTQQPALVDTVSLFSVGEATDLRDSYSTRGHPVLAVASGVSGNVIRLISLGREEWSWTEADLKVRVHTADPKLEGEWLHGGGPISLVRFAIDLRKYDPIRWLLVSNGASITVYEPELRPIPMPATTDLGRLPGRPLPSQLFGNPLFAIPCDRTGGSLQADVCFARHPDADTPQLAIIDQAGYWSLWDVTGRRHTRPKALTPVMKMCGNIVSGFIPKLPSNSMANTQPHQLLWLSLGQNISKSSRRSVSRTRSPPERSRMSADPEPQPSRRILLLRSPSSLHLFDLYTRKMYPVSSLVLRKQKHRILGVAPSCLDPAQVFILTSTSLFWAVVEEDKNDTLTLDILASCPHQKDVNDQTLRLDVSPAAYINNFMACFVCVRSAMDTEMTIFWFISPEPGTPIRYHRDLITLNSPVNFVGLGILPAARRTGAEPTSAAGRAMRSAQLRFFQLLTLGQELEVHCALCAWSDDADVSVPLPDRRETLGDGVNRRLKFLQTLTDAFAVPDEFDERAVFGKRELEGLAVTGLKGGIEQRVDFGLVAQRLVAGEPMAGGGDEEMLGDGVDFGFIGEAVEQKKKDDYMPRHSLLDLVTSQRPRGELLELAREWDARQEALHRRAGEWLFVPEARRPFIDFGPDDLVGRLQDLFVDSSPSQDAPLRHREEVLRNMAAEMFLASIGVSAVPPSWTAQENQLSSSLPFPSSPSIMPSQPSLSSPHKSKGKRTPEQQQGDAVALRLRKYATLDTSPTLNGEPALALSRWELGADPDDISWKPGQDLEAEDAINRRRRKIEARRRKAERLSQRIFGDDSLLMERSSQSFGAPGTQQPPTILSTGASSGSQEQRQSLSQSQQTPRPKVAWGFSSQQQQHVGAVGSPRVFAGSPLRKEYRRDSGMIKVGGIHSSQSQSQSQGTPSQPRPRSQVMPGLFGGRPSFSPFKKSPLKKGKRKSEVRLSGFR
ncbi:RNA polymerase I-specific transcription-initiation factor-domain-containing protein [Thermothelomyces heterothallicus CBS 202.75]|uniref:RNA polymerase I-specific transcription-initiation factor-domain-containing protein n=1 Tax=Thermothelomyces heterothallicus CBS 202.75 TaxID=1149848 RepID=UPI0037449C4B